MDYKRVREQRNMAKRERTTHIIITAMSCIIIVQTIIAFILWASVSRAKTMYAEALNDRIAMQEEINELTEGKTEVSGNYDSGNGTDIPFVTEGGEEIDESGGDN